MNILVVGAEKKQNGFLQKLVRSPLAHRVYFWSSAPRSGRNEAADFGLPPYTPVNTVARRAHETGIDLVFVNSEEAIANGIANVLEVYRIPCFGPTRVASCFHGNRDFLKALFEAHGNGCPQQVVAHDERECRELAIRALRQCRGLAITAFLPSGRKHTVRCDDAVAVRKALESLEGLDTRRGSRRYVLTPLESASYVSFYWFISKFKTSFAGNLVKFDPADPPSSENAMSFPQDPGLLEKAPQVIKREAVTPLLNHLYDEGVDYHGWLRIDALWTHASFSVIDISCVPSPEEIEILSAHDGRDWLARVASLMNIKSAKAPFGWEDEDGNPDYSPRRDRGDDHQNALRGEWARLS